MIDPTFITDGTPGALSWGCLVIVQGSCLALELTMDKEHYKVLVDPWQGDASRCSWRSQRWLSTAGRLAPWVN